jgi:hypothetical protein
MEATHTCLRCEGNVNEAERLYLALGARLTAFVADAPQTSHRVVRHGCNEFAARVVADMLHKQGLSPMAQDMEIAQAVEQFRSAIVGWLAYDREQQERELSHNSSRY